MARSLTGGELTQIRADNQYSQLYLASFLPATIATAQCDATPDSLDQVVNVSIDNWSWVGGYTDAPAGFTVYVGSSAGAYDLGMARLRGNVSGTPSSLDFGEHSHISWANDVHVTIVDEVNIWAKHLRMDENGVVFMDYNIAYSDQHDTPIPVPVLGPYLTPVWMTGATIDVDFDSSDSWSLEGSITGHAWLAPGASGTADLNTSTPVITYNAAGTYRVSCTVTCSNGKSFTGYRWVMVFTDAAPPETDFVLDSCAGSWESGGWSGRVTMHNQGTTAEVRDRGLVCLFTKDWYGGTKVSHGPIANREQILMQGWVETESIEWDPEEGTVSFDFHGPQFWLQNMIGFPSGLESVSGAASVWTDFPTLTAKGGAWHFWTWRTTCTQILDVQVINDSREVSLFNAAPGTLWEQVNNEVYNMIFSRTCCDRFGRLWMGIEPNLIPVGERGFIPTVQAITTSDLRVPVSIERNPNKRTAMVDLSGINYVVASDVGTAYFSLAPGHIPMWPGGSIEQVERVALTDQAQSNTLAGLILGWRNNEYPSIALPLASNHRFIDIFPHQYVTLDISADDTKRGLSGNLTLIPRTVSYSYNPQTGQLLCDVQTEGVTDDTGQPNLIGDPPPTVPPPGGPPPPPPPWEPVPEVTLHGNHVIVAANKGVGGLYYTADLDVADPVWFEIGATPLPDLIQDFVFDPDNENQIAAMTYGGGSAMADVYVISNYTDSGASWVKISDGSTVHAAVISAFGGAVTKYGRYLTAASGGKLLYMAHLADGGTNEKDFSVYGNFSSCTNIGTRIPGPHGNSRVYSVAGLGGGFVACGIVDYSIWKDFNYWSSSDGSSWNEDHTQGVGGFAMYASKYCRGLLATNDGDVVISNWRALGGFPEVAFSRFAGGNHASQTELDVWHDSVAPIVEQGYQLLEGGPGSSDAFWSSAISELSGFGNTYIYKNGGHPSVWHTANITSDCKTLDNFRGWPGGITPEDRIILGNTNDPYTAATPGTRSVWLLTAGGTTIANKTGDLLDTHGVTQLSKVLFDQNR